MTSRSNEPVPIMNNQIEINLENVARRHRRLAFHRAWSWILASATGVGLVLWLSRAVWSPSMPWLVLAWCAATGAVMYVARRSVDRTARDPRWVARRIEAAIPDLNSRLATAVDLEIRTAGEKRNYLHHRLMDEVLAHSWRTDWNETVPTRRLRDAKRMHGAALAAFVVVLCILLVSPGSLLRRIAGIDPRPDPRSALSFQIDPGHVEVERGSGLLVLARFGGDVPDAASLQFTGESGVTSEISMTRSLDDPVFGARLPRIEENGQYVVTTGDQRSDSYTISVFDLPQLTRADAQLDYPEYTGLESKTVVDVRRVTALEGTDLTWMLHLNKPVADAYLIDRDGEKIPLVSGEREMVMQGRLRLEESTRYRLHLTDTAGRQNKTPPDLIVRVTRNRAPDIKWVFPGRDMRVSALEEVKLAATVRDDVGLHRFGVSYTLAGQQPRDIELGHGSGRTERYPAEHTVALEEMGISPDQLVSFYFWAEDTGVDAEVRRGYSDMYFAEVRPFEEIFREGQPQPGGAQQQRQQGGSAAQAEELVERQKQIVNGTWNLIRGIENDLAEDSAVLRDAQRALQLQVRELEEALQDPASLAELQAAVNHMGNAASELAEAADDATAAPLPAALSEEQSAYQALLSLQAREFAVTENAGNQASAGSARGSGSRLQRQLQQLELTNDRNRYETQRQAQEQSADQSENQEAFDRLRDLARRQSDVNERLKELQSALAEASTEEERSEIREALRRLREQQQEILRDTDELAERMGQRQNEEQMSEAREQLEETRSNVRRAAEALEEGQVSRAAAEGTRAEEQFRELREDFRQRSARQFTEEMNELRNDARTLAERQERIGDRLSRLGPQDASSLRGESGREELESDLEQQQEELEQLLDDVRDVVEQAEEAEPLLAETLYDAVRDVQLARTEDALEATRQLLDAGFPGDAVEAEEAADSGIRALRDDIETAAEQVLGDGTEALRRAEEELARLSSEAEAELERAALPDGAEPDRGENASEPGRFAGPGEASPADRAVLPGGASGPPDGLPAPFGGDDFRDWSDRLGDVEQMIDDPELQAQAARIREQARQLRSETRRESRDPSWDLVQLTVIDPLHSLQDRVLQEIRRRGSRDALVPIDADPVPPIYAERVRRYYERLGSGE